LLSNRVQQLVSALGRVYREQTQNPGVSIPLPTRFQIEPTNYCNLRCPICPSYALGDKPKWLSREEFVRIADQLPTGSLVSLYNWGEPFLNPDALPIIREGHQRGLKLVVHSHFNFDPDLLPGIADSGAHIISASIDGATPETYEKFRIKGDFNVAWKNFETLARLIHQRNSPTELRWQFIVNRYNEHELDRAREMVAGLPGAPKLDFIPMGLGQEKVEWTAYSDQELADLKRKWHPKNEK